MSHIRIKYVCVFLLCTLIFPFSARALTLHELIELARKNYLPLLVQKSNISAQKERFNASYDPYYPTLDFSLGYKNYLQSRLNPTLDDKNFYDGAIILGYTLFNTSRAPAKEIQRYTFLREEVIYNIIEKDILKNVKDLYYKIIAEKMKLKSREEALKSAKRSLELATAKRDVGIARLSEVYQANVRVENAQLSIIESQNTLKKLIYELSSIIDKALDPNDFVDNLNKVTLAFADEDLIAIAIERRDEINKEKLVLKALEEEKKLSHSPFYPTINTAITYRRSDGSFVPPPSKEETRFDITLNWNIFSGPGKFYSVKASEYTIEAQKKLFEDTIRNIKLEVKKSLVDFDTATEQIKVSEALLLSAKQNYEQAFEEYRIGKGDLLTLLQSEIDFANARESNISALLGQHLSKNNLERVVGIILFEELR